jgi:acetyl-CoA carboxylase carboxyl transferase subunit alpha
MLFILWKSWEYKEQAAEALKLTSSDMKTEMIDDIIPEPLEEHITIETTFKTVQQYITNSYSELKELSTTDLIAQRMDKYSKMSIKSKIYKIKLIRSLTVSDFFWL